MAACRCHVPFLMLSGRAFRSCFSGSGRGAVCEWNAPASPRSSQGHHSRCKGLEWTGLRSVLTRLHGLPCPLPPEAQTLGLCPRLCGGPLGAQSACDPCLGHQRLA